MEPAQVLHRCKHLACTWTPSGCAPELVGAIQTRRVIPVTASFVNADSKDAKLFADCRAGEVLVVDYIKPGEARGFQAQACVHLLVCETATTLVV